MPTPEITHLTHTQRILKVVGVILIIVALGIAYWLISPIFRETFLDEPLPPFGDAMDSMSTERREEFHRQVDVLRGTGGQRNEAMPLTPSILAQGVMMPRAHEVAGRALIVDTGASRFVRFEGLDTINGPDLRIYLSKDLSDKDFIDLGPIRATNGNVNYGMPTDIDISEYKYVMIWCRAFSVLFSFAVLE